ncbi:MAG TPA: hypothetical protein VLL74_00240 [Methanoregula sp.]|nr:hypothetical protein [Methanoregula sp.]
MDWGKTVIGNACASENPDTTLSDAPVAIAPAPFRAGAPFPPQETSYRPAEVPVIGTSQHHLSLPPADLPGKSHAPV